MIVKILTFVSLLAICSGDIPSNLQPQSNQAVYSQSFVRHDVPLSYKYNAVHIYSTEKPDQYNHKPHSLQLDKTPQKQIQYAPIYNAPSNQNELDSKFAYNPHIIPENTEEVTTTEQTPLEPKPLEQQNLVQHPHQHLSYVPGYNIEVLQSDNRYPAHYAVYRSYPHMSSNAKINKVNFLNQYVPHEKPAREYITTTKVANPSPITYHPEHSKATFSPFVPNQYNPGFKRILYNGHIANGEHAPAQTLINLEELIPHPKTHKMLLNIARTYNFAQNPQKAQHPSLTILKNIPAHTQTIVQIQNPSSVDKNTRLLPIPNKQMRPSAHRWS